LTKSTKYDRNPRYFWLRVIIVEKGDGRGVWGVGCGVWGVGCGVWGVGCGVWGVGSFLSELITDN